MIIDGLSDFGLELIDYLVVRGARNIVIASESKNTNAFTKHQINLWRSYGVSLTIQEELDFTYHENVNALLEDVSKLGTVDGIFDLQRLDNSTRRSIVTAHIAVSCIYLYIYIYRECAFVVKNFT